MRILMINVVCGTLSTGRICTDIAAELEAQGHEVKIAYGQDAVPEQYKKYAVRIGTDLGVRMHILLARVFDCSGFASKHATKSFIAKAEDFDPDILWLHNIHGYYINIEMLFDWIKSRPNMQVKWTLHDCWAFTGHCAYFSFEKCEKWKTQCGHCGQKNKYPSSLLFDNSKNNFLKKKKAFCNVHNMVLIVPSLWLANLVKMSFLRDYPIEVHYNTIDTSVFKPSPSNFRKQYGLEDKRIILGVASVWDERKGFHDFLTLSKMIDDQTRIVLVGVSEKQRKMLPDNIIGIRQTNSQQELAEIYSAAEVLFNPTYEDNYPTVNLEAQACGIPVITYRTGGSPESVSTDNVVPVGDLYGFLKRFDVITKEANAVTE